MVFRSEISTKLPQRYPPFVALSLNQWNIHCHWNIISNATVQKYQYDYCNRFFYFPVHNYRCINNPMPEIIQNTAGQSLRLLCLFLHLFTSKPQFFDSLFQFVLVGFACLVFDGNKFFV